jgi:hypothetical protein
MKGLTNGKKNEFQNDFNDFYSDLDAFFIVGTEELLFSSW